MAVMHEPTVTLDSAALLDSVQEAFLAIRPDGVVIGYNRAAEALLGHAASEVCGHDLDERLRPEYDGGSVSDALARLFAAGPRRRVVRRLTLQHRDGQRLVVDAAMVVLHGVACIFVTDLSRQTAAEDTVERNAAFLAALLDSLDAGVVACDPDGQVVLTNQAMREIGGPASGGNARLTDAYGRPMPWERSPLMRANRGERIDDADVRVWADGDQIRTFAVTAKPITGGDGRHLGAVAVAHEVTALRRAERFRACHRSVERSLEQAPSIVEAAPQVLRAVTTTLGWPSAELFLIDGVSGDLQPAGHWHNGDADPAGFFGHTPIRGAGVTGRVWETGRAIFVPEIGQEQDLRTPYERTRVEICIRNGVHTVLSVPVQDSGNLLGVLTCYAGTPEFHEDLLTVLLDGVAAQIGAFVALRRAEDLARQLTRAQDDFIALVGHELRTPLTSIAAHASLLDEDAAQLGEDHRAMTAAILRNVGAVQRIVDTLLDLAGLDSGHLRLAADVVDLSAVVAEAVAAVRPAAAETGVRLHVGLPAEALLHGDADRLRQVADSLLSNAIKYSPSGGDVRIGIAQQPGQYMLTIDDQGIGTPADERDRVFDRFYRGSNVRHQGTPGNGLGLSLARTIVLLHGGTITLTDRVPTGTCVKVCLPATE